MKQLPALYFKLYIITQIYLGFNRFYKYQININCLKVSGEDNTIIHFKKQNVL